MTTTAMLIATHKRAEMPHDDFYMPVHVGHALNGQNLGYKADDAGDNISQLNRSYCELTALYWAWKNLDADVIGLSHYRRYFVGSQPGPNGKRILSRQDAESLLAQHDIVLSKPRNYYIETIESHYRNGHHGEDLDILREELAARTPHMLAAYDRVFAGRMLSLYNMFLMRRAEFDRYCEWLFDVLAGVEARIDNESRSSYQQRTYGYLGERLLNVWALSRAEELRVGYRRVINTEGEPKLQKAIGLIKRKVGAGDQA